ncbi:MAG: hypothetical protein QXG03_03340 [Halalkalicoccus sp.]
MIERLAPWFGVLLLAVVGIYIAAFGAEAITDPGVVASMGGLLVASLLFIVGGVRESVRLGSRTVPWNVPVGVAYGLMAAVFAASVLDTALFDGEPVAVIMAIAAALGGGSLAWFGVQIARDSRHVELDAEPSSARLVGTALLVVVAFLGGVAVWSVSL